MEADLTTEHERVRRELWAAIYRQAHEHSATRVQPEFRFAEQADCALERFDKRFHLAHPVSTSDASGSPARQGAEPDGQDLNPVSVKDLSASASPATKEQQ